MSVKEILIVGATSDIGLQLIKDLHSENKGIKIWAHGNSSTQKIEKIKEETKGSIEAIQCNLAIAEEVSSFANKIKDQNIDSVIFLAAPPFEYIRFKDLEMKRAREEFQIQYFSTIEILKAVTSSMLQKKSGKIILMLSEVVLGDSPAALTHYTSAKYALLGLLNSLSSEYKSKNIQVNALSPGMIDTQFISKLPHKHAEIAAEASKIKRLLNPADITPRILELLKEDKSGLNLETFGE